MKESSAKIDKVIVEEVVSVAESIVSKDEDERISMPRVRFWLVCISLFSSLFLAMMDTSVVATCLYSIGTDFNNHNDVNWVALSYILANMGCAIVFARVSDIVGRRNALVAAYIIFIAFSLTAGLSQSLYQLVAFRTAQGVGGSGIYSLAMTILPEISPVHKRPLIGTLVGLVLICSGALGPLLGGFFTTYTSWRWVFWMNVPLGTISLLVFLLSWPRAEYLPTLAKSTWKTFDYLGSLLTIAAAVLIVFAFQNVGATHSTSNGHEWVTATFIAPLSAGVLCWVLLVTWQYVIGTRLAKKIVPVIPSDLFSSAIYVLGAINTLIMGFLYFMLVFVVPMRVQVIGGKSAFTAGAMLLPLLGAVSVGTVVSVYMNSKRQCNPEILAVGSCLIALGFGLLITLTDELDEVKLLGFTAICGLALGLTISSTTVTATDVVTSENHASAQGILNQMRLFGGSLGIAASTIISHPSLYENSRYGHDAGGDAEGLIMMLQNAFRTEMKVATCISGLAAVIAIIGYWVVRREATGRMPHS